MPFVVFIYAHASRKFMHLVPKNYIEIDILQIRCHQSTQYHGHDPEAADLTVYLAITVSTFYFFAYIYLYIFIFIWIIFSQNNLRIFICYSCRLQRI